MYLGHKQQSRLNFSEDYVNFELRQTGRECQREKGKEKERKKQHKIKSTYKNVKDVKSQLLIMDSNIW